MSIEKILNLFGLMTITVAYTLILIAFGVLEEERNTYIISGILGLIIGTSLLGLAKLITLQANILKQLEEIARVNRAEIKALNDLKPKKPVAKNPTAKPKPPVKTIHN